MGTKSAIRIVSAEELHRHWDENRVSEKRAAGIFVESVSQPEEASDPRYAGEFSVIVKLYTMKGHHIGTIHQMIDSQGRILDTPGYRHPPHPKDYVLPDCSKIRTLHKQELAPQRRKRRQRQLPMRPKRVD